MSCANIFHLIKTNSFFLFLAEMLVRFFEMKMLDFDTLFVRTKEPIITLRICM